MVSETIVQLFLRSKQQLVNLGYKIKKEHVLLYKKATIKIIVSFPRMYQCEVQSSSYISHKTTRCKRLNAKAHMRI